MINFKFGILRRDCALYAYYFFTLFMVFFSIQAIQNWPNLWAQGAISIACIFPILLVFIKKLPELFRKGLWPLEIKFVLLIIILGILNVCFSENRGASLKGMSLFLMSGIMIFTTTYYLLNTGQAKNIFFYLCSFCFAALVIYGAFEFGRQSDSASIRILLFSSNPIPAGSLLILLSIGPLTLLAQAKSNWVRRLLLICLLSGALVIILIGQRGPLLSLLVMAFIWAATGGRKLWIIPLIALGLLGLGVQFKDKIPPQYKNQLLKQETILARLEFYRVARQVVKDKPLFGIGFNSPMARYVPPDYEAKWYPADSSVSFSNIVGGEKTFDNMVLCFLGEAGGLFTAAYMGLVACLLIRFFRTMGINLNERIQGKMLLLVLAGFFTNSMTFDSLKYPDLNWVFHSLLGLIAQYQVSRQENFG